MFSENRFLASCLLTITPFQAIKSFLGLDTSRDKNAWHENSSRRLCWQYKKFCCFPNTRCVCRQPFLVWTFFFYPQNFKDSFENIPYGSLTFFCQATNSFVSCTLIESILKTVVRFRHLLCFRGKKLEPCCWKTGKGPQVKLRYILLTFL